ncbi:MAG TPA: P1 family peptidase [Pyrinomonadaceae bacterium]|nr:P1 family peptidase [Pyrinomonadaceae bacterium]
MTSTGKPRRRFITQFTWSCIAAFVCAALAPSAVAQQKARARDLGIPFEGRPGTHNAITDVAGVEVGHTTLIAGSGRLVRGQGPVRTGVTAVLPRGKKSFDPVFAAWFPLNGNGEMTGTTWIRESGFLEGPILITNTHSVGVVRDATIDWEIKHGRKFLFTYPIVAETYDGVLNDINGFHVKPEHVFSALDTATGGRVSEGNVGGGTGMLCNGFKGGIGTSSRVVAAEVGGYTVGVLVQCNYGSRRGLRIAGVPVGQEFTDPTICVEGAEAPSQEFLRGMPRCGRAAAFTERPRPELGSIIIVVATDAPLLPHQLDRLVKRAALGLGREGSIASNSSGDIFVAFSTANAGAAAERGTVALKMMPNEQLDPLFAATVQATEEAVTNAMLAAETMTGADNVRAEAIPHERLREIMRKYNRLPPSPASAK